MISSSNVPLNSAPGVSEYLRDCSLDLALVGPRLGVGDVHDLEVAVADAPPVLVEVARALGVLQVGTLKKQICNTASSSVRPNLVLAPL